MKRTGIFLAVAAILVMLCMAGIACYKYEEESAENGSGEFALLTESGFYPSKVKVRVSVPEGAKVYYTTNCEEPTAESGQPYETAIVLSAPESGETVYVLRFRAFYEDKSSSDILTGTYFVGHDIAGRYTTTVLSIVGEPEGLFGYENGILVPGQKYDEFTEANPGVHPGGGVEANYTMRGEEAEREVSFEFFSKEGTVLISQQGGIRVNGGRSRLNNHKSLKLYARKEYDGENNKFEYNFFENLTAEADGTMGQEYKRLLLKNSGQDYGYGFIRTELVGRLAYQAGFPDVQHATPVCVYINGEYYGSYWLENHFDAQYFENRYGEYVGEFVVIGHVEGHMTVAEDFDETELRASEEYNQLYQKFASMDLTEDVNYEELNRFMDVENYLQYYAIENYVGNDDWPDNNVKTYRYLAGEDGYTRGSVFDGRYRMLLFDVDYGFGLMFYHDTFGTLVNEMTLDKILSGGAPLFAALMQREDCRKYFVGYTLDLINGAMRWENVAAQVDELHTERVDELTRTLSVEGLVGGLLLEQDNLNMETVEQNVQRIKDYAVKRPDYVLQDIAESFGYSQKYQLTVMSGAEGRLSRVKVNGIYCEEDKYEGTYLKELPVNISPCLAPNESFSCWMVKGRRYEEETLVLNGELFEEDTVEVELVTQEAEKPLLQIKAVAAKGQEDYVELVNLSTQSVSTAGYYLTDSDDPYQYALPVLVLKPKETVRFVGKSNHSADSLGQYGLNFNLKSGEILQLYAGEEPVDEIEVPKMSETGVYVRDFVRDCYREQRRELTAQ